MSGDKLFPLRPASYTPGLKVLQGGQEMERLYDTLAELLALPDALEPDSDTARRIREVEATLEALEQEEARELQAAFEASLTMPLGAGAALAKEIADVLDELRHRAADDPAAGQP